MDTTVTMSAQTEARASALDQVEARLARIEGMLARFEGLAQQAPGLVAMGGDIADEWARRDGAADARLRSALALADRISRPEMLDMINTIVVQLEMAPGLVAMAGDIVDELARQATRDGTNLQDATANLLGALQAFVKALAQPELQELWESGAFSPEAIGTMNQLARSVVRAKEEGEVRVGLFGAVGRMQDPDVQRAVGFALTMAKAFGESAGARDAGTER